MEADGFQRGLKLKADTSHLPIRVLAKEKEENNDNNGSGGIVGALRFSIESDTELELNATKYEALQYEYIYDQTLFLFVLRKPLFFLYSIKKFKILFF